MTEETTMLWCKYSCIDQSVLMSQGPEIHQIEINYTAPSVSRQTLELNRLDHLLSLQRGNV